MLSTFPAVNDQKILLKDLDSSLSLVLLSLILHSLREPSLSLSSSLNYHLPLSKCCISSHPLSSSPSLCFTISSPSSPREDEAASLKTSPPPHAVPSGFEEPTPQAINHAMAILLGVPPVDNETLAALVAGLKPPPRPMYYPPPPTMFAPPTQYSFANPPPLPYSARPIYPR
ncbi:unnamed protein product [Microthlaspi erraticum]|uniref:Uncharacterized protein n=1 Tax=Microthlaspi erraticum TaxID=1685480 RepID=A0A6D2KRD6_9BRAS|nr:unnamed protein product [Microthlaspi erraticum]CAA7049976.1 unnamed protein product [Microthlaspi erraticum]